ncbi:hypothetical protein Tco_1001376 [Tanacetum coccineum]
MGDVDEDLDEKNDEIDYKKLMIKMRDVDEDLDEKNDEIDYKKLMISRFTPGLDCSRDSNQRTHMMLALIQKRIVVGNNSSEKGWSLLNNFLRKGVWQYVKLLESNDMVLRLHVVVAKDGRGQFKIIMGALAAYPKGSVGRYVVPSSPTTEATRLAGPHTRVQPFATYNFGVPHATTFLALHPQDNNIIAIGKGYKDVHFEAKIATGEGINAVSVQLLVNALLTSMWEK